MFANSILDPFVAPVLVEAALCFIELINYGEKVPSGSALIRSDRQGRLLRPQALFAAPAAPGRLRPQRRTKHRS